MNPQQELMRAFRDAQKYTEVPKLDHGQRLKWNQALEEILRRIAPDQTLLVVPQGLMLNYLARRVNPTPYGVFDPVEFAIYGEDRVLVSLKTHMPDYVVLAHVDLREQGARFFGRDYGQQISAWIHAQYREETLFGSPPLQDDQFGLLLLKRK